MRSLALLLLGACVIKAPGPDATTTPQPEPQAQTPAPELPDPSQPMPDGSIGVDAQLAIGTPASVKIDARADIYSSAMAKPDANRAGVMPTDLALAPGGKEIRFANVHGKTGCDSNTPAADPDGGNCAGGDTNIDAAGGISGVVDHKHTQFLVGVFLASYPPPTAPASLDFSSNESFAQLAPTLGQVFFIGDGMTGSGSGDAQAFVIPPGATHLWLGIADAGSFQGTPGYYYDNTGGIAATVTEQ